MPSGLAISPLHLSVYLPLHLHCENNLHVYQWNVNACIRPVILSFLQVVSLPQTAVKPVNKPPAFYGRLIFVFSLQPMLRQLVPVLTYRLSSLKSISLSTSHLNLCLLSRLLLRFTTKILCVFLVSSLSVIFLCLSSSYIIYFE